jgi:hypothetical protein
MKTPSDLVTCAALQIGSMQAVVQTTNRVPNRVDPATNSICRAMV